MTGMKENNTNIDKVPNLRFPEYSGEWEVKKIIDFAPLQRGFDLPISEIKEGTYPVVFSNGILKKHNEYKAKAPGVVTGRSGTIGKVIYLDDNYWPHNTALWVTDFCNNYPKYVYYFYENFGLERFGTGSGVPTLNRNDLHIQNVLIPSLPEQIKIASFLSLIDERIATQIKIIEGLKELKASLSKQLFSRKLRFKDDNDRDFPEWEEKKLGEVLKVGSGRDYKHLKEGNIPVFGTGGYMTSVNEFLFDGESVCIGRKGTINKPFYFNGKFWTVDTLFYTYSYKNVLPKFIFNVFEQINWLMYNEASGVPSLSKSTIEQIDTLIPDISEQRKIASALSAFDDKIKTEEKILERYVAQKKFFLKQMFI